MLMLTCHVDGRMIVKKLGLHKIDCSSWQKVRCCSSFPHLWGGSGKYAVIILNAVTVCELDTFVGQQIWHTFCIKSFRYPKHLLLGNLA